MTARRAERNGIKTYYNDCGTSNVCRVKTDLRIAGKSNDLHTGYH